MSDNKRINLLIEKLYSKNTSEAIFALNQIRNSGNPNILPQLLEFLYCGANNEVRKGIIEILNDLKIQAATSEIINAIKNSKSQDIQKILLTSIWQSGLDYSAHLEIFVDLFISGNFEIAFEAFTIIDNMDCNIDSQNIDILINKLKFSASDIGNEKADLLVELVRVIQQMKDK
jgi:hypothetical protein